MSGPIELIARTVIAIDGRILLVHKKGAANTFLPGGHVDFGEPAESALMRELREELGIAARVGRFLGAIENCFAEGQREFHELNLVFAAALPDSVRAEAVASKEAHLEFLWQPAGRLTDHNLLPSVLWTLIPKWIEGKPAGDWASTMKKT